MLGRLTSVRSLHWKSFRCQQQALLNNWVAVLRLKFSPQELPSLLKKGIKLSWKSAGNETSQTNWPANSLRMSCTSTDLPLNCILPRIPWKRSKLKHQKACTGPQSITHSFKWQWRCIFGVTNFFPYNCSIFLPNFTKSRLALTISVLDKIGQQMYWQARTNVCQHLKWLSGSKSLLQNKE